MACGHCSRVWRRRRKTSGSCWLNAATPPPPVRLWRKRCGCTTTSRPPGTSTGYAPALLLQESVDRLGASLGLVVVADLATGGGLVPGVLRHQGDLREHVVGVEGRVVGLGQVEHHRMLVRREHLLHVRREEPWDVADPVVVVHLEKVVGEGEVPARDRHAV